MRAPARPAIDGDLAEWGSIEPSAPAASRVAFALTREEAFVVADLGEAVQGGLWFGVGSEPPPVPELYEYRHASGEPLDCHIDDHGRTATPAITAACKQRVVRHAELVAEHDRAFSRLFRVDCEDVRVVGPGGALAAVEGTKHACKPGGARATVEVSLPLASLPRVPQAPLETLFLVVHPATEPRPAIFARGARPVTLPEPISFEPLGDLRALLFAWLNDQFFVGNFASVSYQPGDPQHLETLGHPGFYNRRHVVARTEELFDEKARLGDVSVGYTTVLWRSWLSVRKAGKAVDLTHQSGVRKGILERDGEVHAFWYDEDYDIGGSMRHYAHWHVLAISRDGNAREVIEPRDALNEPWDWAEVAAFASKGLGTFGVRGWGYGPLENGQPRPEGLEETYRWDGKKRFYVKKTRAIPLPPQATRKR